MRPGYCISFAICEILVSKGNEMNTCFNCGLKSDTEVHKRYFPNMIERMLCDNRTECFKRELAKYRKEGEGNQKVMRNTKV